MRRGGVIGRAWIPAILVSNVYSLWGVLFRDWSVGSLFFWFGFEFLLLGATTFVLGRAWRGLGQPLPRKVAELGGIGFLLPFLGVLLYAFIFAAIAVKGEIGHRDRLPEFLADKVPGLFGSVACSAWALVATLRMADPGLEDAERVASQFLRKCGIVLGLYAILMVHHHWSGARTIDPSPGYRTVMGALLIGLKMAAELGVVDRLFRARS